MVYACINLKTVKRPKSEVIISNIIHSINNVVLNGRGGPDLSSSLNLIQNALISPGGLSSQAPIQVICRYFLASTGMDPLTPTSISRPAVSVASGEKEEYPG